MSTCKPISNTRSVTGIPSARLITWWVIASEIVIFGGLLASYVMHRLGHPEWAGFGDAHQYLGSGRSILSCCSHQVCALCWRTKRPTPMDGPKAAKLLRLTALGGLIFLVVKAFEWTQEIHEGFVLSSGGFWSFYYTLAGLHGLHVLAGMIIMLIVAADAAKNQELQRVECIGLYWHFVDIVWIFLFPLLYIAR